jgi:hypothetical protein
MTSLQHIFITDLNNLIDLMGIFQTHRQNQFVLKVNNSFLL